MSLISKNQSRNLAKISLKGYIIVPDSALEAVNAELPFHIESTRKESGCLVFNVTQDNQHRNRFNVYEEFVDRAAFDHHQSRAGESKWAKVTSEVERHYEISSED